MSNFYINLEKNYVDSPLCQQLKIKIFLKYIEIPCSSICFSEKLEKDLIAAVILI